MNTNRCIEIPATFISLLLLVACGGDDSPAADAGAPDTGDALMTGVFQFGVVEGLSYSTATQSGVTNSNGEFRYLAGQDVSFSVGGVVLGSAEAAPQVSPFDLMGISPPSTELKLRQALRKYSNNPQLHHVSNMCRFLMSLDNDADLSNGIVLGDWNTALANASLAFDGSLFEFSFHRDDNINGSTAHLKYYGPLDTFRHRHSIPLRVPVTLPLSYLYQAIDLAVPVNIATTSERDNEDDGTFDSVTTNGYSEIGLYTGSSYDYNYNGNSAERLLIAYNTQHQRTLVSSYEDGDDDGVEEYRFFESFTYDTNRNLTLLIEASDDNNDGDANSQDTYTSTYGAGGYRLTRLGGQDDDADGTSESTILFTYSYDEQGKWLSRTKTVDTNADGTPESSDKDTFSYDNEGFLVGLEQTRDDDADGTPNDIDNYTFTNNASGQRLSSRLESDSNGDLAVDNTTVKTMTLDSEGRVLSTKTDYDYTNNSIVNYSDTETFTFNDIGLPLTYSLIVDTNADGSPDNKEFRFFVYDSRGNRTSFIRETDVDANDVIDSRSTQSYTYDAMDNQLTRFRENDMDANDNNDSTELTTNSYDDNGNRLTYHLSLDLDGDNTPDRDRLIKYSYTVLPDGVASLVQAYSSN